MGNFFFNNLESKMSMKVKHSIFICINIAMTIFLMASTNLFSQQVLKPQEAFLIEAFIQNDVIQVNHRIENGYYLYKDKINYGSTQDGVSLASYTLPDGMQYKDEFFGNTGIQYFGPSDLTFGIDPKKLKEVIHKKFRGKRKFCQQIQKWYTE